MKKTPITVDDDSQDPLIQALTNADHEDLLGTTEEVEDEPEVDLDEAEYIRTVSGTERLIDSLQATVGDFAKAEAEADRPFSHHDAMGAVSAFYQKTKMAYAKALAAEEDDVESFDVDDREGTESGLIDGTDDEEFGATGDEDLEEDGEDDDGPEDGEEEEEETEH